MNLIQHINRQFGPNRRLHRIYNEPPQILQPLLDLEGKWRDLQAVIWGNGPTVDLALSSRPWRDDARHIGTNAAALIRSLAFDVYCVGDKRFFRTPWKAGLARSAPGIRVYQSNVRPEMQADPGTSFIRTIGRDGFCSDLRTGIYHGYSAAYFALQVALWCGSQDILLAGCPHDYSGPTARFYDEPDPQKHDHNLPKILANYRRLLPLLDERGISLRTIGESRLEEAGLPALLPARA